MINDPPPFVHIARLLLFNKKDTMKILVQQLLGLPSGSVVIRPPIPEMSDRTDTYTAGFISGFCKRGTKVLRSYLSMIYKGGKPWLRGANTPLSPPIKKKPCTGRHRIPALLYRYHNIPGGPVLPNDSRLVGENYHTFA